MAKGIGYVRPSSEPSAADMFDRMNASELEAEIAPLVDDIKQIYSGEQAPKPVRFAPVSEEDSVNFINQIKETIQSVGSSGDGDGQGFDLGGLLEDITGGGQNEPTQTVPVYYGEQQPPPSSPDTQTMLMYGAAGAAVLGLAYLATKK